MRYDYEYFDAGLNRVGTRCEKWDTMRESAERPDTLPLWVADMDFPSPPEVMRELLVRAAHPTYGYTDPRRDDFEAVIDFWRRRHGLELSQNEITLLPCVITGLKVAIRVSTTPGDGVVLMTPVYGPFMSSVTATKRRIVDCPLVRSEDGRYRMDFPAIEAALADGAKAVMLCNPHNPVGRLWSREELSRLYETVARYGATLISDEIHADFVYGGAEFHPMLSLASARVVSLAAASKTFNLAGLHQAVCFCRDPELRAAIRDEINATGVRCGNLFALVATRAAYNCGDAWLDGLLEYLQGNRDELARLLAEQLPRAVMSPLEATYLCWIDLAAYGFSEAELEDRFAKAGVCFSGGKFFGGHYASFIRFNIACPRRFVAEGVRRLRAALEM